MICSVEDVASSTAKSCAQAAMESTWQELRKGHHKLRTTVLTVLRGLLDGSCVALMQAASMGRGYLGQRGIPFRLPGLTVLWSCGWKPLLLLFEWKSHQSCTHVAGFCGGRAGEE